MTCQRAAPAGPPDKYDLPPTLEMLQTWHTLRQIDDAQAPKNQAVGARPTGLDQIGQTAKDAGAAFANGVVGIGKTLGTATAVGQEWNDFRAWRQGLPMSRAALDSAVSGLTSIGVSTNQYLASKRPEDKKGPQGCNPVSWLTPCMIPCRRAWDWPSPW